MCIEFFGKKKKQYIIIIIATVFLGKRSCFETHEHHFYAYPACQKLFFAERQLKP